MNPGKFCSRALVMCTNEETLTNMVHKQMEQDTDTTDASTGVWRQLESVLTSSREMMEQLRQTDNGNMRQTSMNIIVKRTIACRLNYSIMYSANQLVSLLISYSISIYTLLRYNKTVFLCNKMILTDCCTRAVPLYFDGLLWVVIIFDFCKWLVSGWWCVQGGGV